MTKKNEIQRYGQRLSHLSENGSIDTVDDRKK